MAKPTIVFPRHTRTLMLVWVTERQVCIFGWFPFWTKVEYVLHMAYRSLWQQQCRKCFSRDGNERHYCNGVPLSSTHFKGTVSVTVQTLQHPVMDRRGKVPILINQAAQDAELFKAKLLIRNCRFWLEIDRNLFLPKYSAEYLTKYSAETKVYKAHR